MAVVPALALGGAERRAMSLVLMVDGLRVDAPGNLNMINYSMLQNNRWHPEYRALFADNCRTVPDAVPDSAPNHAAIITGVNAAKNRVFANRTTMKGNFKEWKPYLARLVDAGAVNKGAFFFLWWEDAHYPMGDKVACYRNLVRGLELWQKDEDCVNRLIAALRSDDTPEAVLFFFDTLDHKGHKGGRMENGVRYGFYPYSRGYIHAAALTDWWIGNILHALRQRPTFEQEDWLIIICADHGGYSGGHGSVAEEMARTTPLLVVSRNIPAGGKMAEVPSLTDIAPTVLKHHGVAVPGLDGKAIDASTAVQKIGKRKLSDGLIYYLPFDEKVDRNAAGKAPVTVKGEVKTASGRFGGAADFKRDGGYLQLAKSDSLKYEKRNDFTVTFWLKSSDLSDGEPVIFANKDLSDPRNPGLAFIRRGQDQIDYYTEKMLGREIFYMFNAGSSVREGIVAEMRKMHPAKDEWLFFAITDNGTNCYVAQGFADGNFYWMTGDFNKIRPFTDMPWNINQDGTGKYPGRIDFQMDDFALWNRALSIDEIKHIFISGTGGIPLSGAVR